MLASRLNWLDYAKAISIMLVVMMHATTGVGEAMGGEGFMHDVTAFFTPFRIPAFFLLSGLLAHRAIVKPWPELIDRKLVFYAYFYVLWLTIQFVFKAPTFAAIEGWTCVVQLYAVAFVQPFGTLWFITVLPVFFIVAKLLHGASTNAAMGASLILLLAPIETGWLIIDAGSNCLFYFLVGLLFHSRIMTVADTTLKASRIVWAGLIAWAIVNQVLLPYADLPGLDVIFALSGSAALIAFAVQLRYVPDLEWLQWVGRNTLIIYLAFFLPMGVSRLMLVELGLFENIGVVSFIVWIVAMIGPVSMYMTTRRLGICQFLFRRPKQFVWSSSRGAHHVAKQAS